MYVCMYVVRDLSVNGIRNSSERCRLRKMYVCMCACMYVCMYVYLCIYIYIYIHAYSYVSTFNTWVLYLNIRCIHTHTHTHKHTKKYFNICSTYTYTHIHTRIHTHICIHIYIHTCTYTYTYTYTNTYTYTYTYTRIHKHMYTHIHINMKTRIQIHIYIHVYIRMHTCIHIHIYIHVYIHMNTRIHTHVRIPVHTHTHTHTYTNVYWYTSTYIMWKKINTRTRKTHIRTWKHVINVSTWTKNAKRTPYGPQATSCINPSLPTTRRARLINVHTPKVMHINAPNCVFCMCMWICNVWCVMLACCICCFMCEAQQGCSCICMQVRCILLTHGRSHTSMHTDHEYMSAMLEKRLMWYTKSWDASHTCMCPHA